MSEVNPLVLTVVAAIALACALLGVMIQWLKSESRPLAIAPGGKPAPGDDPSLGGPQLAMSVRTETMPADGEVAGSAGVDARANESAKADVLDLSDTGELEAYISRHLVAYGGTATALGLVLGWMLSSFAGALAGAVIGTVVGVMTGTAVAAYKRRRG